jgi:predicted transcriptional regulator of viral defense system
MKKRVELIKIKQLLLKPSFTSQEAVALGVSASTLSYYAKTGVIVRLGHGVYSNPNFAIKTDWQWEDLVQVVSAVPNGVVCLITALLLWELTDEHSREFWIAIPHKTKAQKIGPHSRIVRYRNMDLGRTTLKLGGMDVHIFDETRTVLDAFRLLSIEIAIKALKRLASQGKLDFRKMARYSKILRVNITPYIYMVST